jgi:hypothetical protein
MKSLRATEQEFHRHNFIISGVTSTALVDVTCVKPERRNKWSCSRDARAIGTSRPRIRLHRAEHGGERAGTSQLHGYNAMNLPRPVTSKKSYEMLINAFLASAFLKRAGYVQVPGSPGVWRDIETDAAMISVRPLRTWICGTPSCTDSKDRTSCEPLHHFLDTHCSPVRRI